MIKLAIADDHPTFIRGLKDLLEESSDITIVNTYENGNEVTDKIGADQPDVLLLDIQMPGKTGDRLVPILKQLLPELKILVLTNFDSPVYIENLLRLGVTGYMLKTGGGDTITTAIRTVYNGERYIDEHTAWKMGNYAQYRGKLVRSKLELTNKEQEIVQLIANGLTTQEIADTLFLSFYTVENYRQNILIKLDVPNVAAMVKESAAAGFNNVVTILKAFVI